MARMREKAVAPSGWGGSVQPYGRDLVLDVAPYSGDTNSVLVSRTGPALVVDATKTVAINAGAWWAWDIVDAAGQEVDWLAAFQMTVGLSTLPPANSDIEIMAYLADDDPDPAAASNVIWASLRFNGAQNDPDFTTSTYVGTGYVAAGDAVAAHWSANPLNYLASGVETTYIRAISGIALETNSEAASGGLHGNCSVTTTATKWYVGICVSPRSGAGGATDALALVGHYTAQQSTI